MLEKIYKISFWWFFAESILVIFGISIGIISYGVEIATPFMQIGIVIGLILGGLFRLSLRKIDTTMKVVLASILSFFYILLSLYYLLEDQFRLTLN